LLFTHVGCFDEIEKFCAGFFVAIWLTNVPCLQELLQGDGVVGYKWQIHKLDINFHPAELHLLDKTTESISCINMN
jgi:hypothetical protein